MTLLAERLQTASTDKDPWHLEHQGELVDIIGQVWWCGDEWCNCTQAQIVARFYNTHDRRWIVPRGLWDGTFYTEGESGADDELDAKRAELEATESELAARITWPSQSPVRE